ncbi:hypothetical protein AYI69_g2475 [Smittium culicis]|uniref:GSKIP domain-containing protein n=1 Tax=Smittium culicis TaxID=133412 RepID=A0A1R1YMF8_9FUNG|nr:hypothetical protein AYI69_g2475 [Smittium culicis]
MYSALIELETELNDHIYGVESFYLLQDKSSDSYATAYIQLLEGELIQIEHSQSNYSIIKSLSDHQSVKNDIEIPQSLKSIIIQKVESSGTRKIQLNKSFESLTALLRENSLLFQQNMYSELVSRLLKNPSPKKF